MDDDDCDRCEEIDEVIPGAVERRAAELGCRVFSIGDDYGHPEGSPPQIQGSYVLRTAADGSWYDIWATSLPLAGIVDALDCLERELAGDPGAWSGFSAAWSDADEPGRAAFVLRRMSAWVNGESERGPLFALTVSRWSKAAAEHPRSPTLRGERIVRSARRNDMPNGDGGEGEGRPDVSMTAVNARLRAFVIEHREAQAKGDPRAFRESDRLLCAMAEDALEGQARAALAQAEAERVEFIQRGGRVQ